ncbi:MAG: sigma-54 dependent transcriptional regulator [Nitrospirota bacterium]
MKILVADDDKNMRSLLASELSYEGFDVVPAESGTHALELLKSEEVDVALLDLNMPDLGGMDVLKTIRSSELPVEAIILTGFASIPSAVEAMRLGAYDYVTKPFSAQELKEVIRKAFEKRRLLKENLALKLQIKRHYAASSPIIAKSPGMVGLMDQVRRIAPSDLPALILGESGAGKELIARALHEASPRAEEPFIAINCGAIPEAMMESELFGYERGAFTGAYARKLGLLEIAGRGTVFLDEIGELPLPLQVKLLRVIETRSFMRLGGTREVGLQVRFISATNRDLTEAVGSGRFRQDLYYRISPLILAIPPLRERREDIPLLVEHFMKNAPSYRGKHVTEAALRALTEYSWPGNVRELQNVIHRALLLSPGGRIDRADLPFDLASGRRGVLRRLDDVEREHILAVLRATGGQRGKAAEILGIDPKTLYRKLLSYGIA